MVTLTAAHRELLGREALERFLRYVQIYTTSDPTAKPTDGGPSTQRQWDLLRLLAQELTALGLTVDVDQKGYVYGVLAASPGVLCQPMGLLAHVDTSPDQSGENVRPRIVTFDGSPIPYPDDGALTLSVADSAELAHYQGEQIIVASGRTLLGADDKAGVAEIMALIALLVACPEIRHGEIVVCFTRDEEIGHGIDGIDLSRMPKFCLTVDGSEEGSIESECFDAHTATVKFQGRGVHPGFAFGKLINAATHMATFLTRLPSAETPERTKDRQGFYYVTRCSGAAETAECTILLRDFEAAENQRRADVLRALAGAMMQEVPGLVITLEVTPSYVNMREHIAAAPQMLECARQAIRDTGLEPIELPIRGGTDGSRLSAVGHPTPNLFAGGLLFHSRREWVAVRALNRAAETLGYLVQRWAESN